MLEHTPQRWASMTSGATADDHSQRRLLVAVEHHPPRQVVITARGDVDKDTIPQLRNFLRTFFCSAPLYVVLDLSGVNFFDSEGMALLAETTRHARDRSSGFSIVPNRSVEDIMTVDREHSDIVTFPGIDEALSTARRWHSRSKTVS